MQKEQSTTQKLLYLLREIHIPPGYLAIPIMLSIAAAAFEGVGMGLLVPILNGFLQKSFSSITSIPVLGSLVQQLPPSILANDRLVFGVLLGGFVVIYVLKNILRYLATISMMHVGLRCLHHLRKTIFSRYLSFGKLFFDTTNIGHHSTLLTEFTRLALYPIMQIDRNMNALFSLCVYLVVMLFISWKLTLIALPLFILLHLLIKTIIVQVRTLSRAIAVQGSAMGKRTIEILSTIPLVKAYGTERQEQDLYTAVSNEKSRIDFRVQMLQELLLPLQEIVTLFFAAMIFVGALAFIGRDQIASAPSLLVYFYIVINASSKLGVLLGLRSRLAAAAGPLEAVLEIFSSEGKFFVRGGSKEFPSLATAITCLNLTFQYADGREVLRDITCTMERGAMTAIVGPTGAGKSTLINLFMRYYDCPPGTIFVDGTDIREFRLSSYLRHIALVSQETLLLNDSLRNNIAYGLEHVSDDAVKEVVERARLAHFIEQLPDGLDTLIGDRGVKLSGGEKQRVSIARALLKGAEILILDEATSSLDSQTEKLIQEAIDEAVSGRTSIVIAHRLSTIKHADKIIVIDDGQKVEEGTLDALLAKKGTFFKLWEEQKF